MRPHVLELMVSIKYEVDLIDPDDLRKIDKRLDRPIYPVKHTSRSFSWLVVTRETAQHLMDRIGPTLESISGIVDWRVTSLGRDCAARHGKMDPLVDRLAKAWDEAEWRGKWTKPEDLRSTQPGDVFAQHGIEQLDREAAVKMGLRGLWKRQPSTETDKP